MIQAQLDHDVLFRALAPELRAFLTRFVGSPAVAEDLVQDLFLAIWARRGTMRVDGSIRTYLFTAARNRALNHLKHERIADRARLDLVEHRDHSDPSMPGEADFLAAFEIQRAIDALPPRGRLIFTLSRVHGLSHSQIAMSLGLSVKTVELHITRARRSLRARRQELFA